ncbi:Protein DPCD [Echinococcus granulosus]|uniref:Protein DPCD n=1 Tax=Echinococcus granulosus TaxID=6210 RepID=A0A068WW42_ECHGR|nr:Protein DPCD [Echinococcus granulosus]CDS21846.1 protein dpcd [Echinococcus granulosus]
MQSCSFAMATSAWLNSVKEAKKTILVQDGRTKVHYSFPDGKELVEQYDNVEGIITERKWRMPTMLGGEGSWNYEIGQGTEIDAVELRESNINPLFCRRDTKRAFQWRIRNLPYPISTYLLSIEDANTTIVLRTTNKKYYKRFTIPDLERLGVRLDSSLLSKTHSSNTLVISYMKPEIYLQYEKELKKELAKTKPISGGDVPCVSM